MDTRTPPPSPAITHVIDLVPGQSRPMPVVDAERLDAAKFRAEYVIRCAPVVLKGATANWPAVRHWLRPGRLESFANANDVLVARTFNTNPPLPIAAEAIRPLREVLREIREAGIAETISVPAMEVPEDWCADIKDYPFLAGANTPIVYPRQRLFLYRNASTDWHYHPIDETIAGQLLGSKRVSLFRLSRANWSAYAPLIQANFHHMRCADQLFPPASELTKFEAVLEPGDAVYIPPFWWHGIDPVDSEPGITLARCFSSPLSRFGCWEEPCTRAHVRDVFKRNPAMLPSLLAGITASVLCRRWKGEPWRTD